MRDILKAFLYTCVSLNTHILAESPTYCINVCSLSIFFVYNPLVEGCQGYQLSEDVPILVVSYHGFCRVHYQPQLVGQLVRVKAVLVHLGF